MILHIVNQSPFSSDALSRCLSCLSGKDAVILIEDGVYGLSHPLLAAQSLPEQSLFYLQADAQARGVSAAPTLHTVAVNYAEFVDLAVQYETSVSWF